MVKARTRPDTLADGKSNTSTHSNDDTEQGEDDFEEAATVAPRSTEEYEEGRGRSKRRRRALDIAETARRVAELVPSEINKLPIPPELRAEVLVAHQTKGNTSKKRQLKYLAGLFRADEDAVTAAENFLEGKTKLSHASAREFQRLELLRERLLAPESSAEALVALREARPGLDFELLERHLRRYRELGDKAAFRAIFALLRSDEPQP